MAEESIRIFADRVMPELKKHVSIEAQPIALAGAREATDAEAFSLPPS
jgi:hypothetical protein